MTILTAVEAVGCGRNVLSSYVVAVIVVCLCVSTGITSATRVGRGHHAQPHIGRVPLHALHAAHEDNVAASSLSSVTTSMLPFDWAADVPARCTLANQYNATYPYNAPRAPNLQVAGNIAFFLCLPQHDTDGTSSSGDGSHADSSFVNGYLMAWDVPSGTVLFGEEGNFTGMAPVGSAAFVVVADGVCQLRAAANGAILKTYRPADADCSNVVLLVPLVSYPDVALVSTTSATYAIYADDGRLQMLANYVMVLREIQSPTPTATMATGDLPCIFALQIGTNNAVVMAVARDTPTAGNLTLQTMWAQSTPSIVVWDIFAEAPYICLGAKNGLVLLVTNVAQGPLVALSFQYGDLVWTTENPPDRSYAYFLDHVAMGETHVIMAQRGRSISQGTGIHLMVTAVDLTYFGGVSVLIDETLVYGTDIAVAQQGVAAVQDVLLCSTHAGLRAWWAFERGEPMPIALPTATKQASLSRCALSASVKKPWPNNDTSVLVAWCSVSTAWNGYFGAATALEVANRSVVLGGTTSWVGMSGRFPTVRDVPHGPFVMLSGSGDYYVAVAADAAPAAGVGGTASLVAGRTARLSSQQQAPSGHTPDTAPTATEWVLATIPTLLLLVFLAVGYYIAQTAGLLHAAAITAGLLLPLIACAMGWFFRQTFAAQQVYFDTSVPGIYCMPPVLGDSTITCPGANFSCASIRFGGGASFPFADTVDGTDVPTECAIGASTAYNAIKGLLIAALVVECIRLAVLLWWFRNHAIVFTPFVVAVALVRPGFVHGFLKDESDKKGTSALVACVSSIPVFVMAGAAIAVILDNCDVPRSLFVVSGFFWMGEVLLSLAILAAVAALVGLLVKVYGETVLEDVAEGRRVRLGIPERGAMSPVKRFFLQTMPLRRLHAVVATCPRIVWVALIFVEFDSALRQAAQERLHVLQDGVVCAYDPLASTSTTVVMHCNSTAAGVPLLASSCATIIGNIPYTLTAFHEVAMSADKERITCAADATMAFTAARVLSMITMATDSLRQVLGAAAVFAYGGGQLTRDALLPMRPALKLFYETGGFLLFLLVRPGTVVAYMMSPCAYNDAVDQRTSYAHRLGTIFLIEVPHALASTMLAVAHANFLSVAISAMGASVVFGRLVHVYVVQCLRDVGILDEAADSEARPLQTNRWTIGSKKGEGVDAVGPRYDIPPDESDDAIARQSHLLAAMRV